MQLLLATVEDGEVIGPMNAPNQINFLRKGALTSTYRGLVGPAPAARATRASREAARHHAGQ